MWKSLHGVFRCVKHWFDVGVYRIVVLDYAAEYQLFCELFGRIRIALAAEHCDAASAVLIFTTSLYSCLCLYGRCLLSMLLSDDPVPFICLIISHNQAVWVTAAGTDWLKSAVDVSNSAPYRITIRIRFDDTICLNTNTLFGPLFGNEANMKRIFGTSLVWHLCSRIICWCAV